MARQYESVLLVEDDDDLRHALTGLLEEEGYRVIQASNGVEGMKILRTIHRPCLVLLDIKMPRLDGPGFMQLLQADEVLKSVPVVVISAGDKSVPSGVKAFISKPFELDELIRVVKEHARSQ